MIIALSLRQIIRNRTFAGWFVKLRPNDGFAEGTPVRRMTGFGRKSPHDPEPPIANGGFAAVGRVMAGAKRTPLFDHTIDATLPFAFIAHPTGASVILFPPR
jgi:hypothetical protein